MSLDVYTFYSDSHMAMLNDYFLPSIHKTNKMINLHVEKFDQACSSGSFMNSGWLEMMHKKVDYVLYSIEQTWGRYFIHADCDIQFFNDFGHLEEEIQNYDLVAQDDGDIICCGFFICKSNNKMKKLFTEVKKLMTEKVNDQDAVNILRNGISYKLLDDRYYSIYRHTNRKVWTAANDLSNLQINKNIIMHHGNWTVGIENKMLLMNNIRKLVHCA